MSKKKYEKIELISNSNNRNITYYKRIKGLIKKSIELSVLCNQEVYVYVVDPQKKRMLHYSSDPDSNLIDRFNKKLEREFISNHDY
jgi:hypothetical protein